MLVLSRKSCESVVIGDPAGRIEPMFKVTVLEIGRDRVRLGFEAAADVPVHRWEVWERIRSEHQARRPANMPLAVGYALSRRGDAVCAFFMGKKKMLLYLINPSNPLVSLANVKRCRWNRYRVWKPLGLLILAGLTPPEWEVTIIDENLGPQDYAAMPRPDLVGLTAFTSQACRAMTSPRSLAAWAFPWSWAEFTPPCAATKRCNTSIPW